MREAEELGEHRPARAARASAWRRLQMDGERQNWCGSGPTEKRQPAPQRLRMFTLTGTPTPTRRR